MFKNKNIFIALTYKCNAFCKKCMTRYHINKDLEMDIITLERLFSLISQNNYRGLLSVGTGEPLLYKNLELFINKTLEVNDEISLRLLTNGMALNVNNPSIIFDKRCKWGITMDSFYGKELSNLQKGVDIDVVKNNIKSFVSTYSPTQIYLNFTVYQNNVDEIIPFCKFALDNGIHEIYLTELKVFSGYEKILQNYIPIKDNHFISTINLAKEILSSNGVSSKGIDIIKNYERKECYKKQTASPIIDVTGDVSFCSGREDCYIGNIHDKDIIDKWENISKKLSISNNSWCELCFDKQLSNGNYRLPNTIRRDLYD